jgi:hypothetical protein
MPRFLLPLFATIAALALVSCKVETSTEKIPEAEGRGKNAVNIRVEPMTRGEIKDAASAAIDKTADVAGHVQDAASSITANARDLAHNASTVTRELVPKSTPVPEASSTVIATPAAVVTEKTETVTTTTP